MAGAILFLASRVGGFVTGNILPTDGGMLSISPGSYSGMELSGEPLQVMEEVSAGISSVIMEAFRIYSQPSVCSLVFVCL